MMGMKVLASCAAALALLMPMVADAHGPSRQKVVESVEINVPAAKVWARIGNFQDMSWLPVVAKTEGTDGNTPDKAKRELTLKSGGVVDEELYKYDAEKMMYAYRIDKVDIKVLPVNDYSSQIYVTADGDKTKVEWHGAFYRGYMNNDPPPDLTDEASAKAVSGLYRTGLDSLKKELEGGK